MNVCWDTIDSDMGVARPNKSQWQRYFRTMLAEYASNPSNVYPVQITIMQRNNSGACYVNIAIAVSVTSKTTSTYLKPPSRGLGDDTMANGTAVALDLGKTAQCKTISYSFSMGIGRMKQIATKVVNPETAKGENTVRETADRSIDSVIVTTAKASELRSQKRMIDSPELDEIRSQDSKLKRFIEAHSASAGCESTRFVLSTEVESVWRMMEAYRTIRRPQLVDAFMAKYEAAEAADFPAQREDLGNEFNRKDYKPSAEVRQGFQFTYTVRNVGTLELTGLPSFIIEQETKKEQESRAAAVEDFKGILRFGAMELVDSLYNQVKPNIDGKKRRFTDACVDNLLAFVGNWDKQDIAGDLGMAPVIASLKQAMKGVTPEKLKESDNLKAHIAKELEAVKANLSVLVVATGRKVR